jgi:hypothetical protein
VGAKVLTTIEPLDPDFPAVTPPMLASCSVDSEMASTSVRPDSAATLYTPVMPNRSLSTLTAMSTTVKRIAKPTAALLAKIRMLARSAMIPV